VHKNYPFRIIVEKIKVRVKRIKGKIFSFGVEIFKKRNIKKQKKKKTSKNVWSITRV